MTTSTKRTFGNGSGASNDLFGHYGDKAAAIENTGSGAARLAEFFPGVILMHVSAVVKRGRAEEEHYIESLIEFGTAKEVIVTCGVPLEIGEPLSISSPNCSLKATAKVMALQVGTDKYALAIRFTGGAENWIIQE